MRLGHLDVRRASLLCPKQVTGVPLALVCNLVRRAAIASTGVVRLSGYKLWVCHHEIINKSKEDSFGDAERDRSDREACAKAHLSRVFVRGTTWTMAEAGR